jgi:hypothetical protein
MTNQRPPRLDPAASRPRPVRPPGADAAGTARVIAVAALVLAAVALGLTAWRIVSPAAAGCQTQAWDTAPEASDYPDAWTLSATQYDISRKTMSFVGPAPSDDSSAQAVVYATVSCYEQGAEDSVTRSAKAAQDAGQTVVDRGDLGDGGFSAVDDTGATFLQLRHDKIVVYLAASGDATATEVDQLASAFDKALGGDGGAASPPVPVASADLGAVDSLDPNASDAPGSPAAADLEARIPTTVGDVTLVPSSYTGSVFSEDPSGRVIIAALRAAGHGPDDLRVAEAYDDSGGSDLQVQVVTVDGMPVAKAKDLVLDTWLAATGPGVTRDKTTLAGKQWERIDYGDEGSKQYVRTDGGDVIVITTSDPAQAEKTAAGIK